MHTLFEGRNTRLQHIGRVMLGLAILLLALTMIGHGAQAAGRKPCPARRSCRRSPASRCWRSSSGALLTWLAYSSLAMILLIAGACRAAICWRPRRCFTIVLGINLGAALPAITATIAEPRVARRIPLGNLIFRLLGVLLALALPRPDRAAACWRFDADPVRLIVNFHLLFNLALCLGLLAFIGPIGRLVDMLLPEPAGVGRTTNGPRYLDPNALGETPSVAMA